MLKDKLLAIKKYINKHFDKGFISPSIFPITALIILAKKLGGGLQFCVNHRGLNAIMIKN